MTEMLYDNTDVIPIARAPTREDLEALAEIRRFVESQGYKVWNLERRGRVWAARVINGVNEGNDQASTPAEAVRLAFQATGHFEPENYLKR